MPTISVQQQSALTMQLTASTGTHWSWTIVDAASTVVATSDANPMTVTLPVAGDYRALLDATDDDPVLTAAAHAETTFHAYAQPVADFSFVQLAGNLLQFVDASTGEPTSWTWTFPSGMFKGRVPPAQSLPVGPSTVSLEVANPGGSHTISRTVIVTALVDQAPSVSFANDPASPTVDAAVTFTATATDADGIVTRIDWDLDDDGDFDDAAGPWATWSFDVAGRHRVAVRATDERRVATVAFRSIIVSNPIFTNPTDPLLGAAGLSTIGSASGAAIPNAPAPSSPRAALMTPFPVVRIRGLIYQRSVRISLLSVQAAPGATVRVGCHGGSCAKQRNVRVKAARAPVRLHSFERRSLRAGTVIEVFVTAPHQIGKYTRFRVRRGAAPARTDRCLRPGRAKPTACPTT
jgi:PKD repeat protein